jgi:hypothetical protein
MDTTDYIGYDCFDRPEALIVPADILVTYSGRGYIKIRPTQCGGKDHRVDYNPKTRDKVQFEKINLTKILDIEIKFFSQNQGQPSHWGHDREERHAFASARYGTLLIEEFDENYIIEVRSEDLDDKINLSRDMVKEFRNLGYESKIIGDSIFVYVRKKMKV